LGSYNEGREVEFAKGAPEAFPTWEMWGLWHVPHVDGASKWGFHFPTWTSPHFHIFILRWGNSAIINDFEDVYVDFVHENGGILIIVLFTILQSCMFRLK
jgi:hypothetical protein